jgi:DNA-binding CsgD family transcriptional regulator
VHYLASHDVPGAFAASVQAGAEAWRLAAPAEAHRHFDLALSLWDRTPDPAGLSGMSRGKLAFKSALSAADSGQIQLAVKQLRRLAGFVGDEPDPDLPLLCRVRERLAYFLLDIDQDAEAIASAHAAVDVLPAEPPTWERAQALATHAKTLLSLTDTGPARARAVEAEAAAQAAGVPWLEADALATLSSLAERAGSVADALATGSRALGLASSAEVPGVELRVRTLLARIQLESGDLAAACQTADLGVQRAIETGLSMAPYGTDLQYLHYLAHYNDGNWDHAAEIAEGFPVRVTNISEARLSAMALFIDVATGSPRVAERRAWLEPYMATDALAEYIAAGLFAEDAYWAGDLAGALMAVKATIAAAMASGGEYGPQVIRPAAVGIGALADQARLARAAGQAADALVTEAADLAEIARRGMDSKYRAAASIGVDGRGWQARAEAELRRAMDDNAPDNWRAVVDAFGPAFTYETARSRWRLAEALAEAGDRDEAQRQWQFAASAADGLGATRLRAALADLGRRTRLGPTSRATAGSPLSILTSRELEVLHALSSGRSNKEIAAELFISGKTVSVHVSNILAKLGAASRTHAAAIAHDNGIRGR